MKDFDILDLTLKQTELFKSNLTLSKKKAHDFHKCKCLVCLNGLKLRLTCEKLTVAPMFSIFDE